MEFFYYKYNKFDKVTMHILIRHPRRFTTEKIRTKSDYKPKFVMKMKEQEIPIDIPLNFLLLETDTTETFISFCGKITQKEMISWQKFEFDKFSIEKDMIYPIDKDFKWCKRCIELASKNRDSLDKLLTKIITESL